MKKKNFLSLRGKHVISLNEYQKVNKTLLTKYVNIKFTWESKREYIGRLKEFFQEVLEMLQDEFDFTGESKNYSLFIDDWAVGTVRFNPAYSLGSYVLVNGGPLESMPNRPSIVVEFGGPLNYGGTLAYQDEKLAVKTGTGLAMY